ncbi:hypothetical protein PHYBLDRAFT_150464 [Phycomyces blakesleeanus NRRL 1555(-)]|uniref:Uncharacterized protein n=1 Tax=Phycomyces blakesleeanus (strain ATCC 8743b / DSM 1359 / FGSC 10004 / NBRC 33097 / NRRL 1555) TaxID=763407 RepID=A0A162ZPR0_PHYB8|nr:hypothetical protein PHYBLDRAFT_150464 [Phycomyces blakesleeanus NRRL 1555(-)]OAD68281.1 hypothetical protein PHYBLDRAFT_150464 [Phycomyces blakesleeanus NRRL 1555(-)]|eukprot:XP_018286321.1 hypothetical protein PHYBLDRAFT_150464 [Phycomyces blakesleeanus NRRL 1555(-)]
MIVPLNITLLRNKIAKGFSFIKADKWKSWCLAYSLVLLAGRLLSENLDNWMHFVNACRYLAKPSITTVDLFHVHNCLKLFGQGGEDVHDKDFISPNMHLYMHLKEIVLNFGLVYRYWLFSFERYNGQLKNYKTNKRDGFEETFMRKYLEDAYKADLAHTILLLVHITLHHFLIYELIGSVPTLATAISIPVTFYLLTAYGFNLKNFLDSAVVTIDNVKGNEPLPSSVFPLNLEKFMPMEEDKYTYLLEYYKAAYNNTSLKSYRQAVFGKMFCEHFYPENSIN